MIRVFVADDHFVVREGLKRILDGQPDLEFVGESATGEGLVARVLEANARVLLLDVNMPGPGVAELLHHLTREAPGIRTLVLSVHAEEQYAVAMLHAGAQGYLSKEETGTDLVQAIRVLHDDRTFLTPTAARALTEALRGEGAPPSPHLSAREHQVLVRLSRGYGPRQIADELEISPKTVATYVARLREKLGQTSNAGLIRYALERRLT